MAEIDKILKARGCMSLKQFGEMINTRTFISTGYPELDEFICEDGGIPVNAISEIFGAPGSGKSRFVKDICVRPEVHALYIDTENSLPADEYNYLTEHGCDVLALNLIEMIWGVVNDAIDIKDKPYNLIVVDSLAATTTTAEISADNEISMANQLSQAKVLTAWLKQLLNKLNGSGVAVILVNHKKIKPGPVTVKTTPGGASPKFYSSLRLEFSVSKSDIKGSTQKTQVTVAKSRFSPPNRSTYIKMELDWKNKLEK